MDVKVFEAERDQKSTNCQFEKLKSENGSLKKSIN